jgi:hypothetical protein
MKCCFNYGMAKELCAMAYGYGLNTGPEIMDIYVLKYVRVHWEFRLLNREGFCEKYWPFTLKIPWYDPMMFTVEDREGSFLKEPTGNTRGYLEMVFASDMPKILRRHGISCKPVHEKICPGDPGYNPDLPFTKNWGYHYLSYYEYTGELQEGYHV